MRIPNEQLKKGKGIGSKGKGANARGIYSQTTTIQKSYFQSQATDMKRNWWLGKRWGDGGVGHSLTHVGQQACDGLDIGTSEHLTQLADDRQTQGVHPDTPLPCTQGRNKVNRSCVCVCVCPYTVCVN